MTSFTTALAEHIVGVDIATLDGELRLRAKQHFLDSLTAMLSGSTLTPGRLAIRYADSRGGSGESTVAGGRRAHPELAAFANAMSAHADETDDVNNAARIHPGASIIPAAVAVAETYDRSGADLLAAVSLGYDVACAINLGAWESFRDMQQSARTSHGLGQTFGAAAAAAFLAGLDVAQTRHALAYAAQQVSGVASFYRDPSHIEKAFATAAMEAFSGVRAVELVRSGFKGTSDILDGRPGLFDAHGVRGSAQRLLDDLALTRHVTTTDIKRYPVGGPIQAPLQALAAVIQEHSLTVADIADIEAHLPTQGAYIVDNREMPDINLQYVFSVLLLDGAVTFENSHDYERLRSEVVQELMGRIRVSPDTVFDYDPAAAADRRVWRGAVTVRTRKGLSFHKRVDDPRGTAGNPLAWEELAAKVEAVLGHTLPARQIHALIDWVGSMDVPGVRARELRPYLEQVGSTDAARWHD